MADDPQRLKLVASDRAVERVRSLKERASPMEAVREIQAGGASVVTAQSLPRRDPHRPRDSGEPEMIGGMAPTGELEPSVRGAIAETVSKLFGGALKVKMGRVGKAVAKINEQAEVATRNEDTGMAPTKQRAKAAEQGLARPRSPGAGPVRVRGTMDVYGVHFTDSERDVFRRFVNDAEAATKVNIISKMYDNMPRGGSVGGDMSEAQRMAHTRFYFVWRRLGQHFQTICTAAVLEVRSETLGRSFTLEELGAQSTNYSDKALCRAAALGFTKATLWRLAELYLEWNGLDERAREVVQHAADEAQALSRGNDQRVGRAPPVPATNSVKRVAEL